jgi:hypothetical protein
MNMNTLKNTCFAAAVITVCTTACAAADSLDGYSPKLLTDSSTVKLLWAHFKGPAPLPKGTFYLDKASAQKRSGSGCLILIHNGTEIGRDNIEKFEDAFIKHLAARSSSKKRKDGLHLTPYRTLAGITDYYSSLSMRSWLKEAGRWEEGLTVSYGLDPNGVTVAWYVRDDVRIEWLRSARNFFFGADLLLTKYHGTLARALDEPTMREDNRQINWALTAGMPFLRCELRSRTSHIPDLLWLEDRVDEVVKMRSGRITHGKVGDEDAIGFNKRYLYMVLRAKMGRVHYSMHIDRRAFRYPLHSLWVHDIPMGYLEWGAGMAFTSGLAIPGASLSINPLSFVVGKRIGRPVNIEMMPIRIDAYVRGLKQWHFSLKSAIRLPDPFIGRGRNNENARKLEEEEQKLS